MFHSRSELEPLRARVREDVRRLAGVVAEPGARVEALPLRAIVVGRTLVGMRVDDSVRAIRR